jgi:glycosyltransferase involved in cell wall biosynthesis
LRALVSQLDLDETVSVGEPVHGDEKWRLLTEAVGFVYPSRRDACPTSVLEATSIGVPTLTTPYPLGRFFGERGGAIVADPTPDSIAAGLRSLLSPGADQVGRCGAQAVHDEFAWPGLAAMWLERVDSLLANAA